MSACCFSGRLPCCISHAFAKGSSFQAGTLAATGAGHPAPFSRPLRRVLQRGGREPAGRTATISRVSYDEAPAWTLDQSVGLVFGFLLLGLYLSSSYLDKWVAKRQRRQLGLCEECGGLYKRESCVQKECPYKKEQPAP